MISRNRTRVGDRVPVQYVTADLFRWRPPARFYDVCFFGFWLSHVPADRLTGFWDVVASALRPTTVGVSTSSNGFGTRTS
jgi:hypothetical protein